MPYKNANLNIYIRIKSSSFNNKRLQPLIWTRMAKFEKVRSTCNCNNYYIHKAEILFSSSSEIYRVYFYCSHWLIMPQRLLSLLLAVVFLDLLFAFHHSFLKRTTIRQRESARFQSTRTQDDCDVRTNVIPDLSTLIIGKRYWFQCQLVFFFLIPKFI